LAIVYVRLDATVVVLKVCNDDDVIDDDVVDGVIDDAEVDDDAENCCYGKVVTYLPVD
jgi:hypothetical protein